MSQTYTVEKDYRIIKKYFPVPESPPTLQYSQDKALPIFDNIINNDIVVIRLATRWRSKEWPLENWVKLSLWLLNIFDYIIINTSNNSAEIEKAKLDYMDFGVIQKESSPSQEDIESLKNKNLENVYYKSKRILISNGKSYKSETAWREDIPSDPNDPTPLKVIDKKDFWDSIDEFYILEKAS